MTRTALAQTEVGEQLFAENCAVCHGSDGQGRVGATLSKDWPSLRPDLLVKSTIENGVPGSPMPPWSQAKGGPLTQAEIDAIVAYILTWESGGPASIPPTATAFPRPVLTAVPNVEGDPNNGAVLFDKNCAVCHGPEGKGRVGANLSKNWSAIRPDLSLKSTIANGIPGSVMPAWSQSKGGPLAEAEINDLVAFLLALSASSPAPETPTPTPAPSGFFTGWGGVFIALVLFVIVVAVAIIVQARRK
jgi:mono/diheme cytochrome c family protein